MTYDISLIIPAYNVENYIQETLASVFAQLTQARVQCIVIDDASSDKTKILIEESKQLISDNMTLDLLSLEANKGVAFARNLGVSHAKAPYLVFLDADDLLMAGALEYLWRTAMSSQADIIDTEFIEFRRREELTSPVNLNKNTEALINPLHRLSIIRGFPWGKIYRRSLFNDVRYPQGLMVEDIITLPQLILQANRVIKSNRITVAYRKRPGSLSGRESAVKNKYAQHMLIGIEYLLTYEKSRACGFSQTFNKLLWNEMTIVFRSRSFYCTYSEMNRHLYELSVLLNKWISYSPPVRDLLRANFLDRFIVWAIRNRTCLLYRIAVQVKKYNYKRNKLYLLKHYGF